MNIDVVIVSAVRTPIGSFKVIEKQAENIVRSKDFTAKKFEKFLKNIGCPDSADRVGFRDGTTCGFSLS